MKNFLFALVVGFLAGAALAGLLSPSMIAWYFDPPASIGVSCKDAVIWGIGAYQKLVTIGGGVGLVLALVFGIMRKFKPEEAATPAVKS